MLFLSSVTTVQRIEWNLSKVSGPKSHFQITCSLKSALTNPVSITWGGDRGGAARTGGHMLTCKARKPGWSHIPRLLFIVTNKHPVKGGDRWQEGAESAVCLLSSVRRREDTRLWHLTGTLAQPRCQEFWLCAWFCIIYQVSVSLSITGIFKVWSKDPWSERSWSQNRFPKNTKMLLVLFTLNLLLVCFMGRYIF